MCFFFKVTRFISLDLSHVQIKNKNKSLEFTYMHWSIGFRYCTACLAAFFIPLKQ